MDSFRDSRYAFIDMARLGQTGVSTFALAVLVCLSGLVAMSFALGGAWGFYLGVYKALRHHAAPAVQFTQLITIALGALALFFALRMTAKRVLRRPLVSLVSTDMTFRPGRVVLGAVLWLVASVPAVTLAEFINRVLQPGSRDGLGVTFSWPSGSTEMVALILFVAIFPFQAAVEELVFRGGLTQNLGQFIRSRWVLAVIVALVFAAAHGARGWPNFWYYVVLSLGATAVSLSDQRLELAMGAHIMNNLWAATMVLLFSGHPSGAGVPNLITHANWLAVVPNIVRYLLILALLRGTNWFAWQRAFSGHDIA